MRHLIYLHGFLSSPKSHKAIVTKKYLSEHHPGIKFHCPHLSSKPRQDWHLLRRVVRQLSLQGATDNRKECSSQIGVIGSSLGGFWASSLLSTYGESTNYRMRACLINPAVHPHRLLQDRIDQSLDYWHVGGGIKLRRCDLLALQSLANRCCGQALSAELCQVFVQTGDETLDYTEAVSYYARAKVHIEQGGSHAFDDYVAHLPSLLAYLFK